MYNVKSTHALEPCKTIPARSLDHDGVFIIAAKSLDHKGVLIIAGKNLIVYEYVCVTVFPRICLYLPIKLNILTLGFLGGNGSEASGLPERVIQLTWFY